MPMINRISDVLFNEGKARSQAPPVLGIEPDSYTLRAKEWIEKTEKMIAAHPGPCLAVAVGVGLMLGWWVKRK